VISEYLEGKTDGLFYDRIKRCQKLRGEIDLLLVAELTELPIDCSGGCKAIRNVWRCISDGRLYVAPSRHLSKYANIDPKLIGFKDFELYSHQHGTSCFHCRRTVGERRREREVLSDEQVEAQDYYYELVVSNWTPDLNIDISLFEFTNVESECNVCTDFKPSYKTSCGHTACLNCLISWARLSPSCYYCRSDYKSVNSPVKTLGAIVAEIQPDMIINTRQRGSRGVGLKKQYTKGYCYLKYFYREDWPKVQEMLKINPSFAMVYEASLKFKVRPNFHAVMTKNGQTHAFYQPGCNTAAFLHGFKQQVPNWRVGAWDISDIAYVTSSEEEESSDETDLWLQNAPDDETDVEDFGELEESDESIEQLSAPVIITTEPTKVPAMVKAPGDCWQKMCGSWLLDDTLEMTAITLVQTFRAWLYKREHFQGTPGGAMFTTLAECLYKVEIQKDGDLHIAERNTTRLKSKRAQLIADGWLFGEAFACWLEDNAYKTVIEDDVKIEEPNLVGHSNFDKTLDSLQVMENRRAAEVLLASKLPNEMARINRICPYGLTTVQSEAADRLGIPYASGSCATNLHAIHAATRHMQCAEILPKSIDCDVTLVSMGEQNVQLFKDAFKAQNKEWEVKVVNPVTEIKDLARFAGKDQVPRNVFNLDGEEFTTPVVVFHDSGPWCTASWLLAWTRENPKVSRVIITHVFPLASLVSTKSPEPLLYDWSIQGDTLIYVPERDFSNVYHQPVDAGLLLASEVECSVTGQGLRGAITHSILNSHIQEWVPYHLYIPRHVAFEMPEMMPIPRLFRVQPKLAPIPRRWYTQLLDYTISLQNHETKTIRAKMRTFVDKQGYTIPEGDKRWLVKVVQRVAQYELTNTGPGREFNTVMGRIAYATTGKAVAWWYKKFDFYYAERMRRIINEPPTIITVPLFKQRIVKDGGTYGVQWKIDEFHKQTFFAWIKSGLCTWWHGKEHVVEVTNGIVHVDRAMYLSKENLSRYGLEVVRQSQIIDYLSKFELRIKEAEIQNDEILEEVKSETTDSSEQSIVERKHYEGSVISSIDWSEITLDTDELSFESPDLRMRNEKYKKLAYKLKKLARRALLVSTAVNKDVPLINKGMNIEDLDDVVSTSDFPSDFTEKEGETTETDATSESEESTNSLAQLPMPVANKCGLQAVAKALKVTEEAVWSAAVNVLPEKDVKEYSGGDHCFSDSELAMIACYFGAFLVIHISGKQSACLTINRNEHQPPLKKQCHLYYTPGHWTAMRDWMSPAKGYIHKCTLCTVVGSIFGVKMVNVIPRKSEIMLDHTECHLPIEEWKYPPQPVALSDGIRKAKNENKLIGISDEQRNKQVSSPEEKDRENWKETWRIRQKDMTMDVPNFFNLTTVMKWDMIYPLTKGLRSIREPYGDFHYNQPRSWPTDDSGIRAIAVLMNEDPVIVMMLFNKVWPRGNPWDQITPIQMWAITCHTGIEIIVRDLYGKVHQKTFVLNSKGTFTLTYDYKNHTWSVPTKTLPLTIVKVKPQDEDESPRTKELWKKLCALPTVTKTTFMPNRSYAEEFVRALIDRTVGLMGQNPNNEAMLRAWLEQMSIIEPGPVEVLYIEGSPGCRKSKGVKQAINSGPYKDGTVSVVVGKKILRDLWAEDLDIQKKQPNRGNKGAPPQTVCTWEQSIAKGWFAPIVVFDEDLNPTGFMDVYCKLYPWVKKFVFTGDRYQNPYHNPNNEFALNDQPFMSTGTRLSAEAKVYIWGIWRQGPGICNFFRTPCYRKDPGGFHFTDKPVREADDLARFFPDKDKEWREKQWKQVKMFFVKDSLKAWHEVNRAHDAETFAGSQGLEGNIGVIKIDAVAINIPNSRMLYTVATRCRDVIIECTESLTGVQQSALMSSPILNMLFKYWPEYDTHPGRPCKIRPEWTVSIEEIMGALPDDVDRRLAGPPDKLLNREFLEPFYQNIDWDNYIDPDSTPKKQLIGGRLLDPDEEAYADAPQAWTYFRLHPEPKAIEPMVIDPMVLDPLVKTVGTKFSKAMVEESFLSNIPDRFMIELSWKGMYSMQRNDLPAWRADTFAIHQSQLNELQSKFGLSGKRAKKRLMERYNNMPDIKDPRKYTPHWALLANKEHPSDIVSVKTGIAYRINFGTKSHNEELVRIEGPWGERLWDRFKELMRWHELIPFDQREWDEAHEEFEERRASRSTELKKMGLSRADPDYEAFLTSKAQFKIKDTARPLQSIFVQGDKYTFAFGGMGTYMLNKIMQYCPPNVYLHAKRSLEDMQNWVAANGHATQEGYVMCDITQLEKNVKGGGLILMRSIMNHLGIPNDKIIEWEQYKLGLKTNGKVIELMTMSGEILTWLTNTCYTLAREASKFKIVGDPIMGSGDDILRMKKKPPDPTHEEYEQWDKAVEKRFVSERGEFCSYLIKDGLMCKDPITMYLKLRIHGETGKAQDAADGYFLNFMSIYNLREERYKILTEHEQEVAGALSWIFFHYKKAMGVNHNFDWSRVRADTMGDGVLAYSTPEVAEVFKQSAEPKPPDITSMVEYIDTRARALLGDDN
jgi:hypothetical protein